MLLFTCRQSVSQKVPGYVAAKFAGNLQARILFQSGVWFICGQTACKYVLSKMFGFFAHHLQAKLVSLKGFESFVADFKAHPFIKKVFALSHGTRADYVGEECIVRRGRAFTTSCLRNLRLGKHPYGSRGDWPHRRRDHIPDIVKELC